MACYRGERGEYEKAGSIFELLRRRQASISAAASTARGYVLFKLCPGTNFAAIRF